MGVLLRVRHIVPVEGAEASKICFVFEDNFLLGVRFVLNICFLQPPGPLPSRPSVAACFVEPIIPMLFSSALLLCIVLGTVRWSISRPSRAA